MKKILFSVLFILGILTSFTWAEELNSENIASTFGCTTGATFCNLFEKNITSIASGTFINHTNLQDLRLNNNQISSIESGVFNGLNNLNSLHLQSNQISSIKSGVFLGLDNLQDLRLNNNQITSIESGGFNGLNSLLYLYLDVNKITFIDAGDFAGLNNLTYLSLGWNQITSIESGDFLGLDNLGGLILGNSGLPRDMSPEEVVYNQITSIDAGDFAGLNNLTELSLDGNAINSIEFEAFSGLSFLTYLDLNNNQITSIDAGDFAGLDNLTDLYLGQNQINFIEVNGFNGLSSLIYLDLTSNQISSIDIGCFAGLNNLDGLYLGQNQISYIESGSFYGLSSLTDLNLYENIITSIKNINFHGLSSLIYLDLTSNQISSIKSGSFYELSSLNELYLSYNQITSIESEAFNGLLSLNYLDLTNNQITSIDVGDFAGLDNLNQLSLDKNFVSSITSNVFDNLLNLWDLSLSYICTANPETITYPNGSTETDNNYCSIVNSNNQIDFITELTKEVTCGKTTCLLYSLSGNYYTGTYPINFSPGITNEILANIIMQSPASNYSREYYRNNVEVQYDSGTLLTTDGQGFTGILVAPVLLSTGSTKLVDNIVALTKFGDATKRIDFNKPVTVRMPALGKNIDDVVDIFYSQNLSSNWSFHGTSTVIDIAGVPYIEFTTDHATYFAIGEGTGSFVINNDDASTSSQSVTLNISGAMTYMRFSNDGSNRSTWEAISDTKSRTISEGTGTKIVYAEFDIDGDFTGDISTSDTIEYTDGVSGIGVQGNISLEITGGVSECIYGTSLYLGEQDVKLNSGYTFTGSFSGQRYCADYVGNSDGWVFTIGVGDIDNGNGGIISGSNLSISHGGAITQGDSACTGYDGASSEFYTTPYTLIEKSSGSDKICKVTLDSVDIQINVPANQAPGSYAGTLTIYVPNF